MALSQFLSRLSDVTYFTHFTPDVVHQPTVLTCVMSLDGVLTACFVTGELDLAVPHLVTGDTVATVIPRYLKLASTLSFLNHKTKMAGSPELGFDVLHGSLTVGEMVTMTQLS